MKLVLNRNTKALSSIFVLSLVTVVFFQNCSGQTAFTQNNSGDSQTITTGPVGQPGSPEPSEEQDFECKQYIEISADQFTVPSRDENGLCYYKALFTGVGSNKSSYYFEAADSVDYQKPLLIQEEVSLIVNLEGERKTIISGSANEEKSFLIDNFLLLEIPGSKAEFVGWSYFYDKTMLIYNKAQQTVPKKIYITQSTKDDALVNSWDISNKMSLNQNINIKLTTLDNGGAYQISNTYIVFK